MVPPLAMEIHWHPQMNGAHVIDGAILLTVGYVALQPHVARIIRSRRAVDRRQPPES